MLSVFNGKSKGAAKLSPIPSPLCVNDELRKLSTNGKKNPDETITTNKINKNKIACIFDILYILIFIYKINY
jgi:hypothetical protein